VKENVHLLDEEGSCMFSIVVGRRRRKGK